MKQVKTYLFILILAFFSATILSLTAVLLRKPQEKAQNSYRYKELLKAAALLSKVKKEKNIVEIATKFLTPMLTNKKGEIFTFEEKNLSVLNYLEKGQKDGYAKLPLKIFYQIKNGGIVIPLSGTGLWDAIYGYIGIAKNGYSILGISWYEQKETPGLGGEIQNPTWQKQFIGKILFHGKKMQIFGLNFSPKEMTKLLSTSEKEYTVDAISGATITTHGVQNAIKDSLSPYIPLLKKMQKNIL